MNSVSDDYIDLLGIPLLNGRVLRPSDADGGRRVVVLNEVAARDAFGEGDPVGRRIRIGGKWAEVVGVVGGVMRRGPDQAQGGEAYFSFRQERAPGEILVRTAENTAGLVSSIRRAVQTLDPGLAVSEVASMEEIIGATTRDRRLILFLLSSFTAITVFLVVTGTSGLVAYSLSSRHQELGLRMALGGEPASLLARELRGSLGIAASGLVVGLPVAWGATRLIQAFLFHTDPGNPTAFLAGAGLILCLMLLATLWAAKGVWHLDPAEILREGA